MSKLYINSIAFEPPTFFYFLFFCIVACLIFIVFIIFIIIFSIWKKLVITFSNFYCHQKKKYCPKLSFQKVNVNSSSMTIKIIDYLFIRNGSNFLFKMVAWLYTGSHSMFAECIHSFADTANQLILAYGIHKSVQVNR